MKKKIKMKFKPEDAKHAACLDVTALQVATIGRSNNKSLMTQAKQAAFIIGKPGIFDKVIKAFLAGDKKLLYVTTENAKHRSWAVRRLLELYSITALPVSLCDDPECADIPRREKSGLLNVLYRPAAPECSILLDRGHAERIAADYKNRPHYECEWPQRVAEVIGLFATDTTGLCKAK